MPPGTDPMWGYDGAPEWATITDGAPRCQFQGRDISPAGNRAFEHFYFDTDGIQTALVETWGKLAEEFKDEPAVAGYDLLNEPGFGETAPVTTSYLLGRYYDRAIEAIRAAGRPADRVRRAQHPLVGSRLRQRPAARLHRRPQHRLLAAPLRRVAHHGPLARAFRRSSAWPASSRSAQRVADSYGAPLWSGEYGYWGDEEWVVDSLTRYADARGRAPARQRLLGLEAGLRRPAERHRRPTGNGLMVQDCETGEDARPAQRPARDPEPRLPALGSRRAHRRSTREGADARARRQRRRSAAAASRSGFPGDAEPDVEAHGHHGRQGDRGPGGWSVTGCAEGDYTLSTS